MNNLEVYCFNFLLFGFFPVVFLLLTSIDFIVVREYSLHNFNNNFQAPQILEIFLMTQVMLYIDEYSMMLILFLFSAPMRFI